MPHILVAPESYDRKSFVNAQGNSECVEFIKQTLHAPPTSHWSQGKIVSRVPPGETDPVAKGTAIATFIAGKYPQAGNNGNAFSVIEW